MQVDEVGGHDYADCNASPHSPHELPESPEIVAISVMTGLGWKSQLAPENSHIGDSQMPERTSNQPMKSCARKTPPKIQLLRKPAAG
jgi:hypothetical protein